MSEKVPKNSPIIVDTEAKLAQLLRGPCWRILEMLQSDGPKSSREIALILGMSSPAVIYHLREMERQGFLFIQETRSTKGRPESVYAATANTVHISRASLSPDALKKVVSDGLRLASREALNGEDEGRFARISASLSSEEISLINGHLDEIEQIIRRRTHHTDGEEFGFTYHFKRRS